MPKFKHTKSKFVSEFDLIKNPPPGILEPSIVSLILTVLLLLWPTITIIQIALLLSIFAVAAIILTNLLLYFLLDDAIPTEQRGIVLNFVLTLVTSYVIVLGLIKMLDDTFTTGFIIRNLTSTFPIYLIAPIIYGLQAYSFFISISFILSKINIKQVANRLIQAYRSATSIKLINYLFARISQVVFLAIFLLLLPPNYQAFINKTIIYLSSNDSKDPIANSYQPRYTWSFTKYKDSYLILDNQTSKSITIDDKAVNLINEFVFNHNINSELQIAFNNEVPDVDNLRHCIDFESTDMPNQTELTSCVVLTQLFSSLKSKKNAFYTISDLYWVRQPDSLAKYITNTLNQRGYRNN